MPLNRRKPGKPPPLILPPEPLSLCLCRTSPQTGRDDPYSRPRRPPELPLSRRTRRPRHAAFPRPRRGGYHPPPPPPVGTRLPYAKEAASGQGGALRPLHTRRGGPLCPPEIPQRIASHQRSQEGRRRIPAAFLIGALRRESKPPVLPGEEKIALGDAAEKQGIDPAQVTVPEW